MCSVLPRWKYICACACDSPIGGEIVSVPLPSSLLTILLLMLLLLTSGKSALTADEEDDEEKDVLEGGAPSENATWRKLRDDVSRIQSRS